MGLRLKIYDRRPDRLEPGSAAEFFVNSYLGVRFAIGMTAFWLPFVLILIDRFFLEGQPIRGSMSAYYHSGAREVFVGGLFMVGAFLVSYMSARPRTWDFVLSLAAGVAVILVALFPTARYEALVGGRAERFEPTSSSCTEVPGPPVCASIQATLGESATRIVHAASAGTFVLLLAALCVVFALREFGYGPAAEYLCGRDRNVRAVRAVLRENHALLRHLTVGTDLAQGIGRRKRDDEEPSPPDRPPSGPRHARRALAYLALGVTILVGAVVAITVSTYWGEVIAFLSFGLAWMYAGKDLGAVRKVTTALHLTPPPKALPAQGVPAG